MPSDKDALGPAEHIIQTVLGYNDHMVHNRPGVARPDNRHRVGVRWEPVTHKEENGEKVVYRLDKVGTKTRRTKLGTLRADGKVENGQVIGEYRPAGIFPEVAAWLYGQVAEVWKLDNEFSARWASYAFPQDHRDLKVVLAAFMLVQSRKGDPIKDGDVVFNDDDFRDIGEAMCLLTRKDKKDFNPKLLLRVHDVLRLPAVAKINNDLGFGRSARHPFYGRWPKAVEKWLRYREENPKMLEGLVKAGFRTTVMELARRIGYKPSSPAFFETLRWKQKQAEDGRRVLSIGKELKKAETWENLTERQICNRIAKEKPNWKRIVGLLPQKMGVTRAIMMAAIEAKSLSDKDLVILTPTLEELGMMEVQEVKERWELAVKAADDMRSANIARNVRSKEVKEKLEEAADASVQKAVEEVVKDIEIYVFVDTSGSMEQSIVRAKEVLEKFLHSFPLDRLHVATFNTSGRQVVIDQASAAGVRKAFRGIRASGGTSYGAGVRALQRIRPKGDADVLFIFVGDELAGDFHHEVVASGLNPMAFGLVRIASNHWGTHGRCVQSTAAHLGLPCFHIEENTFNDTYAIPRTIRALVSATPVSTTRAYTPQRRKSFVEEILDTELLKKPVWA